MPKKQAPGKAIRKGITLKQKFPYDAAVEVWFARELWQDSIICRRFGSPKAQNECKNPRVSFRRWEKAPGRPQFIVKTGAVMESSNISCQDALIASLEGMTSLNDASSMKLHVDRGAARKSARCLARRLRSAWSRSVTLFAGPVQVDETYFGGKRESMPNLKRQELTGRGAVSKTAVVGGIDHETVEPTPSDHVKVDVRTNGVESLRILLKRAYKSTFHRLSPKHMDRCVQGFTARQDVRERDNIDQIQSLRAATEYTRLRCRQMTAANDLFSGARV